MHSSCLRAACCLVLLPNVFAGAVVAGDWTQWGGDNRDFKSLEKGIAATWPAEGPRTLWKRELGEGYSAIIASGNLIYTMYRAGDDEHVVALDAETGEPRWDHAYAAPMPPKADASFGRGPNATPLLAGNLIITVGFTGRVHCLDAATGKAQWSHDLCAEFGVPTMMFGYASSPLRYNDTVILPVGGKGHGLMAFALSDGKERWSSADFDNTYSSPIIVAVGAEKHIVLVMSKDIVGLNAENGKLVWSHPYKNQWDTHCTTPVNCGKGRIFFPTFGGGTLLEVTADLSGAQVKELWKTNKVGMGQANVVCVDEHLYGASGSESAGFFSAVDVKDGKAAWRVRLPLTNVIYADGRLIALDENGTLSMMKASAEKMEKLSQATLLEHKAWTVPTLADGKLYLRDQKHIMAVSLK